MKTSKPMFMQAAEQLAKSQGVDARRVLARFAQGIRASTYPTPECLEPIEVEQFAGGQALDAKRVAHLSACAECAGLLEVARPSAPRLSAFLEQVRDREEGAVTQPPVAFTAKAE